MLSSWLLQAYYDDGDFKQADHGFDCNKQTPLFAKKFGLLVKKFLNSDYKT